MLGVGGGSGDVLRELSGEQRRNRLGVVGDTLEKFRYHVESPARAARLGNWVLLMCPVPSRIDSSGSSSRMTNITGAGSSGVAAAVASLVADDQVGNGRQQEELGRQEQGRTPR